MPSLASATSPTVSTLSRNSWKAAHQQYRAALPHPLPFSFSFPCASSCCKRRCEEVRTSRRPSPCPAWPQARPWGRGSLTPAGSQRRQPGPALPCPAGRREGPARPHSCPASDTGPAAGAGAARQAARCSPLLFRPFEDELGGLDAGILGHGGSREGWAHGAGPAPGRAEALKPRPFLPPPGCGRAPASPCLSHRACRAPRTEFERENKPRGV